MEIVEEIEREIGDKAPFGASFFVFSGCKSILPFAFSSTSPPVSTSFSAVHFFESAVGGKGGGGDSVKGKTSSNDLLDFVGSEFDKE